MPITPAPAEVLEVQGHPQLQSRFDTRHMIFGKGISITQQTVDGAVTLAHPAFIADHRLL